MPAFDRASWRFPFDQLTVHSAVLCLRRIDSTAPIYCEGGRMEFLPIELPDINHGYTRTSAQELHVLFKLPHFEFESLSALAGRRFTPSEGWHADHCGSLYAFSAHNPVDTLDARFGEPKVDTIPISLTLRFDFDFEGRIGGVVQHDFCLPLSLEKRWELLSELLSVPGPTKT